MRNWSKEDIETSLNIDWTALGIESKGETVFLPQIDEFQDKQTKVELNKLIVPRGKGYLIHLEIVYNRITDNS